MHDLVRKFGDFTAVNRTSFEVKRGEVFGLLGPNGAGKTTTFRMLCGLLPATSGTLKVAGADLRRARAEARQNIGYVAQKFSLYGDISVLENLRVLRWRLRFAQFASGTAHRVGAGQFRAQAARVVDRRFAARRLSTPPGDGRCPAARARHRLSRRADERRGSLGTTRILAAYLAR